MFQNVTLSFNLVKSLVSIFYKELSMEFLELILVLVALLLIIKKPEKENLAFSLVIIAWFIMVFLYVGHKSSNLLTTMNL